LLVSMVRLDRRQGSSLRTSEYCIHSESAVSKIYVNLDSTLSTITMGCKMLAVVTYNARIQLSVVR
jgi:hypothetical protein